MKTNTLALSLILSLLLLSPQGNATSNVRAARLQAVEAPVLKWQNGGCYSSWCETGWYASPAVADLDGNGVTEVIGGAYSLFILNGEDGSLIRRIETPGSRIWPGVVVADLEGDSDLEIVISQGSSYVSVYDHTGETVWVQQPGANELRSLAVGDLDNNGDMEIVVGQARLDRVNTWVLEHDGSVRAGWPKLGSDEGSAAGLYNDNIGLGDLDGDGELEVIVPSDVTTICAYEPDGTHLGTHEMYHDHPDHDMDHWGEIPAYVDLEYETRGWGPCSSGYTIRANFANGPANVVDVNHDGINEVVVIGDVHDCNTSPYTDVYNGPYILNADRSRFNADGFDWTTLPINTGAPVIQNYNVIESVQPSPATVDLDGDGNLEILYPSYDGRMHAFWLDKTEHHNWPYAIYTGGPYRFASEPVVADLDNDGHPEVIFASWVQKGTNQTGKLHILDYQGNALHEVDLPLAYGSPDWNGALAAPTLANIDADADLEVVLNTAHAGFVAYDLPGTANARVLWGTGRGNYQRTGTVVTQGTLQPPQVSVTPVRASPGDTLAYTIRLENAGPTLPTVYVTSTLSPDVTYLGDLAATSGSYGESGGVITWSGAITDGEPVLITYSASLSGGTMLPTAIINYVQINDGQGNIWEREAVAIVNARTIYLPVVMRGE